MSIGVAGGGIAGTATAIALARKGFEVAVIEQSAAGETAGAGMITSSPGDRVATRAL